jgi:hypothetical protein
VLTVCDAGGRSGCIMLAEGWKLCCMCGSRVGLQVEGCWRVKKRGLPLVEQRQIDQCCQLADWLTD